MVDNVPLDNIAHAKLRVNTRHGKEFSENVNQVQTFPTEFADIQQEYPILFRKDQASGEYQSVAILGLQPEVNLFLDESGWNANYIPAVFARGPFMIGFQAPLEGSDSPPEPVIHVDMSSPRLSETEGEPVFLPQGGQTAYLERIAVLLNAIYQGLEISKAMFDAFEAQELIVPVDLEIKLGETEQVNFRNYYTISEERLAKLDGDGLLALNQSGFLRVAFLVVTSLSNIRRLVALQHKKDLAGRGEAAG